MVEVKEKFFPEDEGFPSFEISDPERSGATYTVRKVQSGGYNFFQVSISKGSVPATLTGFYTKHAEAIKDVKRYLETKGNPSTSYRAKQRYDERESTNA